jgi:uncharacterized integral membrane protein
MEGNRPGQPLPELGPRGTNWKQWAIGTAVVLLFILIAQNAQSVELNFLFASVHTPLIFALLIAAGLGALVGWLVPRVRRPRKKDGDPASPGSGPG